MYELSINTIKAPEGLNLIKTTIPKLCGPRGAGLKAIPTGKNQHTLAPQLP